MSRILIADLTCCLIEEKTLKTLQRTDHVPTLFVSLLLSALSWQWTLRPVWRKEDLLDQGKAEELFLRKQGEDLVCEEIRKKLW